jgi:hypothetical protein
MRIGALLTIVIALVFGIGNIWVNGPSLWRDYQIRAMAFMPAPDLNVRKAHCTTYWFVLTDCGIEYTAPGRPQVQSLSYGFLGPLPEKKYRLMRLADRPDVVVADIGINYLTNRLVGLCVFTVLMGFAVFGSWRRMGAREQQAAAPVRGLTA